MERSGRNTRELRAQAPAMDARHVGDFSTCGTELCPASARDKDDTLRNAERVQLYADFLAGKIGIDEAAPLLDLVYKCQNCGACSLGSAGPFAQNAHPGESDARRVTKQSINTIRERAVDYGYRIPGHTAMIEQLQKEANIFGKPKEDRGRWADGLAVKDIARESADVIFHAGCKFAYDKELQPIARAAVSILMKAGVDVGIAGEEESCCGCRAYEIGYLWEFNTHAEKIVRSAVETGATTLVTACSDCYYAFKRLYGEAGWGINVEVLHILEYIERLIRHGDLVFTTEVPLKITYHDPCHIGRKMFPNALYDQPRAILEAIPGVELVEMERIRDCSWCCGAGGGVDEAYPDLSAWSARERVGEARMTGADALVTACPWCERNFRNARAAMGEAPVVYDIIDLIMMAMK